MSKELGPREKALREMREARASQNESRAKATKGKAGTAGVTGPVRRSTAGTGLRVGVASAVLPTTSELMDVTAGETAPNSGSVSVDKGQEARKQAPSLEKGSTPLLSITNSKLFETLIANQFPQTAKRGRPKKGEIRSKPWEAAGISKAQWYRNQKGK